MPRNVIVDAGFLTALLKRRDSHHAWAVAQAAREGLPWQTCEAVLAETLYLLGPAGAGPLCLLLQRAQVQVSFDFAQNQESVLSLIDKYANVPMSFADACLVRMTELLADPVLLTVDADFRIYRRNGRQVVPCIMP